jgi:phage shock protein A
MGVLGRFKDIAAADLHHLLDRMEDPVIMCKHYIRELEEQIDQAQSALGEQSAAARHYDQLIARTEQQMSARARQAELAVSRGEERIAEMAIQDKLHCRKLMDVYTEQRGMIRENASLLLVEIDRMTALHRDLSDKLFYLSARANAAHALEQASQAAPVLSVSKITRGFARMEEKVWRLETRLQSRFPAVLESQQLQRHEQQAEVRAELERLQAVAARA